MKPSKPGGKKLKLSLETRELAALLRLHGRAPRRRRARK